MNLEQIQQDIDHWIQSFLEKPNPALNGWAPCPYARRARLDQAYQVQLGNNIVFDLMSVAQQGLGNCQVLILAYDAVAMSGPNFEQAVHTACQEYLLPQRLIALPDHPDLPETVNGVALNQGTWALIMIQNLSDLDQQALALARKGYYHSWPESYLDQLFRYRKDPRS